MGLLVIGVGGIVMAAGAFVLCGSSSTASGLQASAVVVFATGWLLNDRLSGRGPSE